MYRNRYIAYTKHHRSIYPLLLLLFIKKVGRRKHSVQAGRKELIAHRAESSIFVDNKLKNREAQTIQERAEISNFFQLIQSGNNMQYNINHWQQYILYPGAHRKLTEKLYAITQKVKSHIHVNIKYISTSTSSSTRNEKIYTRHYYIVQ